MVGSMTTVLGTSPAIIRPFHRDNYLNIFTKEGFMKREFRVGDHVSWNSEAGHWEELRKRSRRPSNLRTTRSERRKKNRISDKKRQDRPYGYAQRHATEEDWQE